MTVDQIARSLCIEPAEAEVILRGLGSFGLAELDPETGAWSATPAGVAHAASSNAAFTRACADGLDETEALAVAEVAVLS